MAGKKPPTDWAVGMLEDETGMTAELLQKRTLKSWGGEKQTNNKPLTPTPQIGRLLTLSIFLILTLIGPFSYLLP